MIEVVSIRSSWLCTSSHLSFWWAKKHKTHQDGSMDLHQMDISGTLAHLAALGHTQIEHASVAHTHTHTPCYVYVENQRFCACKTARINVSSLLHVFEQRSQNLCNCNDGRANMFHARRPDWLPLQLQII